MTQSRFFTIITLLIGVIFFITAGMLENRACGSNARQGKMTVHFANIPLYFIANEGQMDAQAKFYAKTSRYTVWLTKKGLVFHSVKGSGPQKLDGSGDRDIKMKRNVSRLFLSTLTQNLR